MGVDVYIFWLCTLYVGDEIYMLNTGGLALIPPYTAHMTTYLAGSDHSRYLLYFDTEELDFIAADSSLDIESIFHKHPVIHIPERRLDYITSVIQKISYEHNGVDSLSLSFVHSYFHELILLFCAVRCTKIMLLRKWIQVMNLSRRLLNILSRIIIMT